VVTIGKRASLAVRRIPHAACMTLGSTLTRTLQMKSGPTGSRSSTLSRPRRRGALRGGSSCVR
jgi:hypothetical protein